MDDRNQGSRSYWTRTWRRKHDEFLQRNKPSCATRSYPGGIFLDQSISDCGDRTAGRCGRLLRVGLETGEVKRHGCRRIDRKGRLSVREGPARIHRMAGRFGMEIGELTGRKDTNPPSRKEGERKTQKERKSKWLTYYKTIP